MPTRLVHAITAVVIFGLGSTAVIAQATNAVCPDPKRPCHNKNKKFDVWELSFQMPARIRQNKTYTSAPFYAVMLEVYKLDEDCDGGEYIEAVETERKQLQAEHPARKVFASYSCPNLGGVGYDFAGKWDKTKDTVLIDNFLAIYAGPTKGDADALLPALKAKYPKAAIKRMTASYEWLSF